MPKYELDKNMVVPVLKRAFFLAFQSAGSPCGMGVLQDRGPGVSEDHVWENVQTRGDYPGGVTFDRHRDGTIFADYVFGRMLKLRLEYDEQAGTITTPDHEPDRSYQGWTSKKYPSYGSLVEDAIVSLGAAVVQSAVRSRP